MIPTPSSPATLSPIPAAARRRGRAWRRLRRSTRGAITAWMLLWTVGFLMLGGVAVDGAKAWRMRAALQAVADASAHAGSMMLGPGGEAAAKAAALTRAEMLLPPDTYGNVLRSEDVEVGRWDPETRNLLADGVPDTVRVTLRRSGAGGNAEPTVLLKLAGLMSWDVSASSAARNGGEAGEGGTDSCWENGLIARGVVDIQSNNVLRKLCVHGQQGVSVNNNNVFDAQTIVSMPDPEMLTMPSSGFSHNPGLREALRTADRDPWIVDHIDDIIYGIRDAAASVIWIDNAVFDITDAVSGPVYWVYCTGNGGTMTVPPGTVLEDLVVLTNCAINFRRTVTLINTLIGTTGDRIADAEAAVEAVEDATTTVTGGQELYLGLPDNCAPGGGSRLLIDGDFKNPAQLRVNGSQIIASGDIEVSAQGESIEGISFIAGGDIDLTSNNVFGLCDQVDFRLPVAARKVSLVD